RGRGGDAIARRSDRGDRGRRGAAPGRHRGRGRHGGRSRRVSGAFRRAVGVVIALALVSACTEPAQPKPTSSRDSEAGPKLSRDAAAILLQYSAYDYGLAGALSGAKTRTVAPARYGLVSVDTSKQISAFSSAVLTATLDRTGPTLHRLIPRADALTYLG